MSRKYEGLIVLHSGGQKNGLNDLVTFVAGEMEDNGAKMTEIQQLGHRKFAYNARHLDGGHYVNYVFEADPANIGKIRGQLSLNKSVYLQHYRRLG